MGIEFNHTIVWSHDSRASARFLADMLGLPAPKKWGPFQVVTTANSVNVDFMDKAGEIRTQHYAFLVSEVGVRQDLWPAYKSKALPIGPILRRPRRARSTVTTADAASISRTPSGHLLEVITRPYGSSGWEP